jgi:hypothetical protein
VINASYEDQDQDVQSEADGAQPEQLEQFVGALPFLLGKATIIIDQGLRK